MAGTANTYGTTVAAANAASFTQNYQLIDAAFKLRRLDSSLTFLNDYKPQ